MPAERAKRQVHAREDRVIGELCLYLSIREKVDVRIRCHPDRKPGHRRACDAILRRGGRRAAVEHTRIFSAPKMPGLMKRVDEIRPAIARVVMAAFPRSWVLVWIPAENFRRGLNWGAIAADVANRCVAELRQAGLKERVKVEVPPLRSQVFAEQRNDDLDAAIVSVHPGPEDFMVDDIRRALTAKQAIMGTYRSQGYQTILVLDTEEYPWFAPLYALFERATERVSLNAFDEIYMAATIHWPSLIVPLRLGDGVPVGQPVNEEFMGLWQMIKAHPRPLR